MRPLLLCWRPVRLQWERWSLVGSAPPSEKPTLLDPDLFRSKMFRLGVSQQMLQQIALGGAMIALPIYLQMVLEYNAMGAACPSPRSPSACSELRSLPGRRRERDAQPASSALGFALLTIGMAILIPIVPRADSGWWLVIPLVIAGSGLGLLVSQLNNYTLSPISRSGSARLQE